jgi:hypothetical protein
LLFLGRGADSFNRIMNQTLHYRVEAVASPAKRRRRGRPPKAEAPQGEVRYHLVQVPIEKGRKNWHGGG